MPEIGQTVSHYKIMGKLGEGGMGVVYRAEDTSLNRQVAIKFLSESEQRDPMARKRFLREARAAAALDHPFICQVHETDEVKGKAFIVMEYVSGKTLKDRLAHGCLPLREALVIACEVAEALHAAHQKNIVHRDLKPTNIMLTAEGHPKIMDFGLAKQITEKAASAGEETMSSSDNLTRVGTVLGTAAYMSPEQARGETVDARSDIFSFGVVLYEMLSGASPFQRQSTVDTLSAIIRDPSPPLHMEADATPSVLSGILGKALAKIREERYQSIRDMADDLHRLLEQLKPQRGPQWVTWTLGAAALVVVAFTIGVVWFERYGAPPVPAVAHLPVSVLIADFENRTGEPVFEALLEKALEIGLEGAPFITSYSRNKARHTAKELKPDLKSDLLDRALAGRVAQREGINLVLAGLIESADSGYHISVDAVDPFTAKPAARPRDARARDKDDVLPAMARLAVQLREDLGDTVVSSTQTIARETFTASSLEAARSYAVGQDLIALGKNEQAIEAYQSAIRMDPELGRAYAGLAAASANLNRYEDARKYYMGAMKRIDRMTERERHRTLGGYYLRTGDGEAAIQELRMLTDRYPADEAGLTNLAYGYFLTRDMALAAEAGAKAVKIYPKNILARGNLALFYMYAGDFDAAFAEAAKALELQPGYESAFVCQAVSELVRGRVFQAQEIYQKLAGVSLTGASLSVMGQGDLYLYQGRLAQGGSILELGVAGDLSGNNPDAARKLAALAGAKLSEGKTSEALRAAAKAVSISKEPRVLFEAAEVYVGAGRTNDARSLAKTLDANLAPDVQVYAHVTYARTRLKEGDREGAIRELEDIQKIHDSWLGRFELGRAYIEAGKYPEAYSQFDQCRKRRGEATAVFLDDVPTVRYLPPLYYYLGRAQEGLGSPAAAESYRTFLSIKEKGGEPLLEEVRRRLAALK